MTEPESNAPATPLATIAAWLEHSGYVLRRVYAGHYVFRHPASGAIATVPAEPLPETVARHMSTLAAGAEAIPTVTVAAPRPATPGGLSEADLLAAAASFAEGAYQRSLTPLEGGRYLVEVAPLGRVLGQGDTIDEANRSAQTALTAALAVLIEDGDAIPAPLGAVATGAVGAHTSPPVQSA
jgi:predicted RNase H-like HicB family nuclease/predicted RNA binding protein YcfA (HicA-like mRNA interferase family)